MNEHGHDHVLHDPNDAEVEVIWEICKDASTSTDPPYKALFTSYDAFFAAQGLESARDHSIFRWIMRIADRARAERRSGTPVNFLQQLKSLLDNRGIHVVLDGQNWNEEGVTRSIDAIDAQPPSSIAPLARRVSFDDARLEETWLSEHSKSLNPVPQPATYGQSHRIPYRTRNVTSAQVPRARSISSQRDRLTQQPASDQVSGYLPQEVYTSEYDGPGGPTLLFEHSQTELEQNAEAFLMTSELRKARQCLNAWYDRALLLQGLRNEATRLAITHDRRILLKQSLSSLCALFRERRREHEHHTRLNSILEDVTRRKDRWLLAKAFSHWDESARHQKRATAVAQRYAMKVKYFQRWHRIATENALKVRSVYTSKYLNRWRERVAELKVAQESALAYREMTLIKRCFQHLFWTFCSRRVDDWHEQQIQRRSFNRWRSRLDLINGQEHQAEDFHYRSLARRMMRKLKSQLTNGQQLADRAGQHYDRELKSGCLQAMVSATRLAPLANTTSNRVELDLLRRAMNAWRFNLSLNREATAFDRKRILHSAWTSWNDALRCKALGQRIDERILVESLYKWVLQERLRSFEKARERRSMWRSLDTLTARYTQQRSQLNAALVSFEEQNQRHCKRSAFLRLYSVYRSWEGLDRSAVEFVNTRTLPTVIETWREQARRAQQMGQWADDARFYCLATRTLKLWRNKTSEHKHNRRREAYAEVRSKLKYKMVKNCFTQWRAKATVLRQSNEASSQHRHARLRQFAVGIFDNWRGRTMIYIQLERQAAELDRRRLEISGLSALTTRHADVSVMEERATEFHQESDLILVSNALKRIKWGAFIASQHTESMDARADALQARFRDQHLVQMLRHLASEAARRRAAKSASWQEPESPSLRPASRHADRRAEPQATSDEFTTTPQTPAYMQTPARHRSGRFRPLPTPALFTPMVFDPTRYATTPATLPAVAAPHDEGLTPRITPFAQRLRAGGIGASALRSSMIGATGNGTNKSVRFARASRFSRS